MEQLPLSTVRSSEDELAENGSSSQFGGFPCLA